MVYFNIPTHISKEIEYIRRAVEDRHGAGQDYTNRCTNWLQSRLGCTGAILTSSCTAALEAAALMCEIAPGDEVIMPSFTFASTANAFVRAGATPVFVDIRPDTMNIDETQIEAAITPRTRIIAVVHYAGIACEMDTICATAKKHGLIVIEDAAQAFGSYYKGQALGTVGDIGCFSFHKTKNISMGEGGALLINRPELYQSAELITEKGTNRLEFLRKGAASYCWQTIGGSFTAAELNAAQLWAQLECAEEITKARRKAWQRYYELLLPLAEKGILELPVLPEGCEGNGHIFYIRTCDSKTQKSLISHLKESGIEAVFHYSPLHASPAGLRFGRFHGEDRYTSACSERLVRLPIYHEIMPEDQRLVTDAITEFFNTAYRGNIC